MGTLGKLMIAAVVCGCCRIAAGLDVAVDGGDGKLHVECARSVECGVETVAVEVRSLVDGPVFAKIVATQRVGRADVVWDGMKERKAAKAAFAEPLLAHHHFLMGAAWDAKDGTALALGAEDLPSFAELSSAPLAGGAVDLAVTVPAAFLRKGARFACRFHRVGFSPKYGIRDALARYYPLYPARFKRDPRVNPAVYGTSAQYACWRGPDPERCRLMNATWEWCIGAGRTWGDPLNREQPVGAKDTDYCWGNEHTFADRTGRFRSYDNPKLSREEFARMRDGRFAAARYCGVANGFYMMALANISNVIAARHPDSLVTENPGIPNDYPRSTEVFTFPECSWGRELRAQLAQLVKECDIAAVAFDVSRPLSIYRGVRLREMDNVGWDSHGAGVVRGAGSAKLFDFIRTLPNKAVPGNCGVVVNTKYHHLSDMLHVDTMMMESEPWSRPPPFPLALRYALGEKGLTLWEGYSPRSFAPDFAKWPEEDQHQLLRDLARYAVHRSFATGASLPCGFLTEYVAKMSNAFVAMNDAGWKPIPGATADGGGWEIARYGSGDGCYLAVCNETNAPRRVALDVWPGEIAAGTVGGRAGDADGYLFAPFFGGEAEMRCGGKAEKVGCDVGPLLANVLEAAGTLKGRGSISAGWSGDFDAVTLAVKSADFAGELRLRKSFGSYVLDGEDVRTVSAGGKIEVKYRNTALLGLCGKVRAFPFADGEGRRPFRIEHAADGASKDMAERFEFFFWKAMTPPPDKAMEKRIRRNGRKPFVACRENAKLSPRTVVLRPLEKGAEPIAVTAPDDEGLSRLVRRVIGVINRERFPGYVPAVEMPLDERARFPFVRL